MPRKANQSNNWNFIVSPTRLYLPDGTPTSVFGNVRTDTKQVLGTVSEKGYGMIQNMEFVSTIRDALTQLGLGDHNENILVANDGRKLYATYQFDQRIKTLHKVGDQVGLVLRFANSFDGSLAAMGELRAKILRCQNGMTLEKGQFALQSRHNPKINLGFVQKVVGAAVSDFDRALAVFDTLAGVFIDDQQGVNILKRLPISEAMREKIQAIWITPNFAESRARSLYTLYDAVTEHLRDLEGSRFEQAAQVNRKALRFIVRGIDPNVLPEMIAPVPPKPDKTPIATEAAPETTVPAAPTAEQLPPTP
jgi:hypothetical protein